MTADRVRFLGLNGGPMLNVVHAQPAIELIVEGTRYLVDCGAGTARQTIAAGDGFSELRHVFITHHHLDHTAGLAELTTLGWCYQQAPLTRLGIWGPPPIAELVDHLRDAYRFGIELFETGAGFPPSAGIVHAHELALPAEEIAEVMEDDLVRVRATRVYHGPAVRDAYAYRFDVKHSGRSVVFSGDTAGPNANLIALADQADLLVHEVLLGSRIPAVMSRVPPEMQPLFREHLALSHTDVADLPAVAQAAGARRLAFCHYGLERDPEVFALAARRAAAEIGYRGEIIAPTEFDEIAL